MQSYIGIKPGGPLILLNQYKDFKKELLLFNSIFIDQLNYSITQIKESKNPNYKTNYVKFILKDLEWLQDKNLIVDDKINRYLSTSDKLVCIKRGKVDLEIYAYVSHTSVEGIS